MKEDITTTEIQLPKKIICLPDAPSDGVWNVTRRIASILTKRFFEARKDPHKKITKKDLMRQETKDMITSSDNNIIAKASPKQREDAFGMFLDTVLEDTRFHKDFNDAMQMVKEDKPDKFLDIALKIQGMRHPVDKDMNVDINVEIKQTMYSRLQKQYQYSEMIEEAEVIDPKQITEKSDEYARMLTYQSSPEEEDSDSTF